MAVGMGCDAEKIGELVTLLTVHAIGCRASFTQWAVFAALEGPRVCIGEMFADYRCRKDYGVAELCTMPRI